MGFWLHLMVYFFFTLIKLFYAFGSNKRFDGSPQNFRNMTFRALRNSESTDWNVFLAWTVTLLEPKQCLDRVQYSSLDEFYPFSIPLLRTAWTSFENIVYCEQNALVFGERVTSPSTYTNQWYYSKERKAEFGEGRRLLWQPWVSKNTSSKLLLGLGWKGSSCVPMLSQWSLRCLGKRRHKLCSCFMSLFVPVVSSVWGIEWYKRKDDHVGGSWGFLSLRGSMMSLHSLDYHACAFVCISVYCGPAGTDV